MSGIEIAGLILAVIPIFVAAAEHLQAKKGSKTASRARSFKGKLNYQKTLLDLYLKGLVGRTSLSPRVKCDLIDEPTGELWKDPDIVKALSQELGDDVYESLIDLLNRICTAFALCVDEGVRAKGSDQDIVSMPTWYREHID